MERVLEADLVVQGLVLGSASEEVEGPAPVTPAARTQTDLGVKQSFPCQGLVKLRTWSRREGSFDSSGPTLGSASGGSASGGTAMTGIALPLPPLPQGVYSSVEETDPPSGSYDPEWAGLGQGNPGPHLGAAGWFPGRGLREGLPVKLPFEQRQE